jgi:glycerol-3-phosphate acyltransferase PlsY
MNGIGQWTLVSYLIDKLDAAGTPTATLLTLGGILLCIVIPYLLGSVNFGLIISNKKFHDDIRTHGSGNAGTTNMLRTYGKRAAALTLLGDMLKAVIAVGLGYLIVGTNIIAENPETGKLFHYEDQFGAAIAGFFVMMGHMFPIFFKFKGGKGVATSAMVILMISPITCLFCLLIFIIIVVGTRYVSLGSVMGLIFYPILLTAFSGGQNPTACAMSVLMALAVVFMHRENLKRLREGTERKITFKKKKPVEGPSEEEPKTDK